MAHPQMPTSEALAVLAAAVSDHEKRLRWIERVLYTIAGALSGSGGVWFTVHH